jgi:hypothetical protein
MGFLLLFSRQCRNILKQRFLTAFDRFHDPVGLFLSENQYTPVPLFLQAQNVGFMGIPPLF